MSLPRSFQMQNFYLITSDTGVRQPLASNPLQYQWPMRCLVGKGPATTRQLRGKPGNG